MDFQKRTSKTRTSKWNTKHELQQTTFEKRPLKNKIRKKWNFEERTLKNELKRNSKNELRNRHIEKRPFKNELRITEFKKSGF